MATFILPLEPDDPIQDAGPAALTILSTRPDAVMALAHEKLYTFPFNEVPVCWRRLYEEASIYKANHIIQANQILLKPENRTPCEKKAVWKAKVIRVLDMAIILTGSPGRRAIIDSLLADLDDDNQDTVRPTLPHSVAYSSDDFTSRAMKRARLSQDDTPFKTVTRKFPSLTKRYPILLSPIPHLSKPSLSSFQNLVLNSASGPTPLILTDTLTHWPARTRWRDPNYWLKRTHGGRRLIPIELGRAYTDDGWGQVIIPFGEYLRRWLLRDATKPTALATNPLDYENLNDENDYNEVNNEKLSSTAYLAQYDMLSQIPLLRADIAVPDYCYIDTGHRAATHDESDDTESNDETDIQLNLWLGPSESISPLHTDPHHNLLAQVLGTKYVRLYAPAETCNLYPMGSDVHSDNKDESRTGSAAGIDMSNTASVDISLCIDWTDTPRRVNADVARGVEADEQTQRKRVAQAEKYPRLQHAKFTDCVLSPGDVLFIPRGWWHYVQAFPGDVDGNGVSCSVSFWWD